MEIGICDNEKVVDNINLPESLSWSDEHIGSLMISC